MGSHSDRDGSLRKCTEVSAVMAEHESCIVSSDVQENVTDFFNASCKAGESLDGITPGLRMLKEANRLE